MTGRRVCTVPSGYGKGRKPEMERIARYPATDTRSEQGGKKSRPVAATGAARKRGKMSGSKGRERGGLKIAAIARPSARRPISRGPLRGTGVYGRLPFSRRRDKTWLAGQWLGEGAACLPGSSLHSRLPASPYGKPLGDWLEQRHPK